MNRDQALALQKRSLREWVGSLAGSSVDARQFERDGVRAAIVPATPQRSIPNSVTYGTAAELAAALDDLAGAYEDASVAAWTVWVPDFDHEAIAVLDSAGHVLDGSPAAMSIELADFEPLDPGDLDWSNESSSANLGRVNDLAYGVTENPYAPGLAAKHPDVTLYEARVDGEVATVLATIDHGADLGFYFVATDPQHQGKGLVSRLMSVVLQDARTRGLETSTLQSSAMGQPVYERLGFVGYFRLNI